jgi:hypothetical protein
MVCQHVALMFSLKMRKDRLSIRNVWLRVPLLSFYLNIVLSYDKI